MFTPLLFILLATVSCNPIPTTWMEGDGLSGFPTRFEELNTHLLPTRHTNDEESTASGYPRRLEEINTLNVTNDDISDIVDDSDRPQERSCLTRCCSILCGWGRETVDIEDDIEEARMHHQEGDDMDETVEGESERDGSDLFVELNALVSEMEKTEERLGAVEETREETREKNGKLGKHVL
jgi:hypothetical protein